MYFAMQSCRLYVLIAILRCLQWISWYYSHTSTSSKSLMLYWILFPNVQKPNLSMGWPYIRLVCPPATACSFPACYSCLICHLYTNWDQRQHKLVTQDFAKHDLLSFYYCNIWFSDCMQVIGYFSHVHSFLGTNRTRASKSNLHERQHTSIDIIFSSCRC